MIPEHDTIGLRSGFLVSDIPKHIRCAGRVTTALRFLLTRTWQCEALFPPQGRVREFRFLRVSRCGIWQGCTRGPGRPLLLATSASLGGTRPRSGDRNPGTELGRQKVFGRPIWRRVFVPGIRAPF